MSQAVRTLDFAPRGAVWTLLRLGPAACLTLAALLLVALAGLWHWSDWQQRAAVAEAALVVQQEHASAQRTSASSASASAAVPLTPAQLAQVNGAIRQLNLPWTDLLDAIQQARGPRVALLDLVPDAAARRVRGSAEVASPQDMVRFIERLKQQDAVAGAELTEHQRAEGDARQPLRFGFVVRWRE